MKSDAVDDILEQWSGERPELETESLGVVIRVLSLARRFQREASEALAPLELELHEYDALSALRRQGTPFALPATTLAAETGLSSGAMTNRVDGLAKRGLVRRDSDPQDRRAVIVSLTEQGIELIDKAIRRRIAAADRSLQGLSVPELARLAALLRKARQTGIDD